MFVFASGRVAARPSAFISTLSAGLDRLASITSDREAELTPTRLPGALCITARDAARGASEITEVDGRDHYLLIFGDPGEVAPSFWMARMAAGSMDHVVAEMAAGDGCFGALVYSKADREIRLFGDVAGQRTLRWALLDDGSIVISSHDLGLVAAGAAGPRADAVSMASVASMGWSVGDRSLLEGVSVCRAGEIATWRPAATGTDRSTAMRVAPLRPTPPADDRPLAEIVVGSLDRRLRGRSEVRVELTAGFDSRATLAATLALRDPRDITVFTEGPDDAVDVRVARQLSERAGLRFEHRRTAPVSAERFRTAWSRTAARCNGMIDISVLASRREDEAAGRAPLTVCGDVGEIYHGYYQSFRPLPRVLGLPANAADAILRRKMIAPSLPDTARAALEARLLDCVAGLRAVSVSEWRVLDLFLQTQRFGVWNQRVARDLAHDERVGLFYGRHGMIVANASPARAAEARRLHHDLVRAHLPNAMDVPINGEETVHRHSGGRWNDTRLDAQSIYGKVARRVRGRLGRIGLDLEGSRAAAITRLCAETLADGGFVAPGSRFEGPAERIEGVIRGGKPCWAELGALRFLAICADVHDAARRAADRAAAEPEEAAISEAPSSRASARRAS